MQKTSIPWTNASWNWCTGCDPVSAGCKYCYAESITHRFPKAFPNGFDFTIHRDRFDEPKAWRKPSMIFGPSMSDPFHEKMPFEVLQEIFGVMADCPRHIFQMLTKRHERLAELAPSLEWHPNIWMGVTVENQTYADRRILPLVTVPAAVRFLSVEPLLGPVELDLTGIDWVIVGCESGPKRRPMKIEWARAVRDQCAAAGTVFFMKQIEVGGKVIGDQTQHLNLMSADLRVRKWPLPADLRVR